MPNIINDPLEVKMVTRKVLGVNMNRQQTGGGGGGVYYYGDLPDKPSVNGVMLVGNQTSKSLGIESDLPEEVKQAMLQLAQKVAYVDSGGQEYYNDLYRAFYPGDLVSISVVYDSANHTAMVGDAISTLTPYLTVTAQYDDGTGRVVTGYSLTGSLSNAGANHITATYSEGGIDVSQSFDVTAVGILSIEAIFDQGDNVIADTASLNDLRQYLIVSANYTDGTSMPVDDYSLSGTLTAGTCTITAAYAGKTDTFNVTVTSNPLDQIAWGTLTYRDIFLVDPMCRIGRFENSYTVDGSVHTFSNGDQYRFWYAGKPTVSTQYSVSPTHSLKAFGTSPQLLLYTRRSTSLPAGTKLLLACNVKVDRYVQGIAGAIFNGPIDPMQESYAASISQVTDGFVPITKVFTLQNSYSSYAVYIGATRSANLDCYVDEVRLTTIPNEMTDEEAQTIYENYTNMILGGAQ